MVSAVLDASLPALIAERYRVEAALGRGGAARLYRVTDLAHGRTLALKLLHAGVHPKLRELFELEYQTLASLEHPRTPQVFEFGSDALGVFYTMELLEGEDLRASAPLSWRTVCDCMRDASQALGVLHARNLIHRDVSPRNLWRTPDGRTKLIDFGALAPFGPSSQIIGTPPLIPPEAVARRALDQRADLYALGGVAYFLLTGVHAFPAYSVDELPKAWCESPLPPSLRLAQLNRPDLPAIPEELDALVLALLSANELVRPSSTAEVIDRIDALRGATRDSEVDAARFRLTNVAYVGRTRERRRLSRRLALALRGRGQNCVIESSPGSGRSRALKELELAARVTQASVLHVSAAAGGRLYGLAEALAQALLDAVPERARAAAAPYAPLLAHLSARVRERLETVATPPPEIPGELRVRVQEAQRDWFLSVARERLLVLLVDGLEHADDGSAAFLLALALAASQAKLLIVCALVRDRARERSPAVRALLKASHSLQLPQLTEAELHALLQTVFGTAEHLARLSARLFELTRGNTGYALELCRQLVERGAISFESGSWMLPRELDTQSLSGSLEQALAARRSRVTGPARQLLRLLSVHAGPLSPPLCRALATSDGPDLLPHLGELIQAEILVNNGQNLLFAHERFRRACLEELAPEACQRARRALAEHILSLPEAGAPERLEAGAHLVAAGDARGPAIVVRESWQLAFHEGDRLAPAAAMIEATLRSFRARNCSAYEQVTLLTALTLAGYEGERRYVVTYGEEAVHTLAELLGLPQARTWSRFVGGKLALIAAIGLAAARFVVRRGNPCVPRFVDALYMLFTATAAAAGGRTICFDPEGASRLAEVLQPFAAFGGNYPGGFMYEFCQALAETARDHPHETCSRWRRLLDRFARMRLLGRIPDAQRRRCRGGALYAIAGLETNRDSEQTLRSADSLEDNGLSLDRVYADQVRTLHYGYRGDIAAYEHYRQRAELHAIARGSTWQFETWTPGPASGIALNLHDALSMKSASEHMRRMSEELPSLVVHARHMRGAYLLLRGKYAEAVPFLADCLAEPPGWRIALARAHGVLARAYNRLGDHARALATCTRVFENYSRESLDYLNLNLIVQTEHVIAEAGLGRVDRARELLAGLRARLHASQNPLLLGQLLETGLEIALIERDPSAAREQLAQLEAVYRPLSIPSLAQHCEVLDARIEQLEGGPAVRSLLPPKAAANANSELPWSPEQLPADAKLPELAERALQLLAESTRASHGALYLVDGDSIAKRSACLSGEPPSPLVERWITERLARELEDERTVLDTELSPTEAPWNLMHEGTRKYRMLVLVTAEGSLVALAALGREDRPPAPTRGTLLRGVADRLYEAICEERTERSSMSAGNS